MCRFVVYFDLFHSTHTACLAIADELNYSISQTDPKKTIHVGGFRLQPDGSLTDKKVCHEVKLTSAQMGIGFMPTSAVTVCKQHISLQALLCFPVVHYKYFTAWHNERNLLLLMEYYCWQGERGSKRSNSTMICLSNCVFVVAAHEHILILTPSSPLELLHILNCQFHKMCK